MDFSGKVALVTGGANGIGRAAVHAFAKAGAKVAVVDRDQAGAEAVASAVKMANGDAISLGADVTKADEVAGYVRATLDAYGRIDCFFNNAGIEGTVASIVDYDEAMLTWFDRANHPESLPVPLGTSIDDPHSLNNLRLASIWARKARLLSYKHRGIPKKFPDTREARDWTAVPPMPNPPG